MAALKSFCYALARLLGNLLASTTANANHVKNRLLGRQLWRP